MLASLPQASPDAPQEEIAGARRLGKRRPAVAGARASWYLPRYPDMNAKDERVEMLLEQILKQVTDLNANLRTHPAPPQAYDPERAAELLSTSVSTVRRLVANGTIRTIGLGSRWKIPASEIARLCTPRQPLPQYPYVGPRRRAVRAKIEAEKIRQHLRATDGRLKANRKKAPEQTSAPPLPTTPNN